MVKAPRKTFSMKTPSWGSSDYPEEKKQFEEKKQPRFWMPRETEKEIIFISPKPFVITEHNLQIDGSYRNWFTCVKDIPGYDSCPLCERASRLFQKEEDEGLKKGSIKNKGYRYQVGLYTVIDTRGFTASDGTEVKNMRRILAAKQTHLNMFKVHSERRGDLAGSRYLVNRSGQDTSAGIGDGWEYQEKVDLASYFPEGTDISEFDYSELLAPKSKEELEAIVAMLDGTAVPEVTEAEIAEASDDVTVDYS